MPRYNVYVKGTYEKVEARDSEEACALVREGIEKDGETYELGFDTEEVA